MTEVLYLYADTSVGLVYHLQISGEPDVATKKELRAFWAFPAYVFEVHSARTRRKKLKPEGEKWFVVVTPRAVMMMMQRIQPESETVVKVVNARIRIETG